MKKPTEVSTNSAELTALFQGLKCNGRHTNDQVWDWQFAERVVQGTVLLIKRIQRERKDAQSAYPVVMIHVCTGCKSSLPGTRQEHNRDPAECKYHHIPVEQRQSAWTCPGCTRVNPDGYIRPRPRGHKDHTNDPQTCRIPWMQEKTWAPTKNLENIIYCLLLCVSLHFTTHRKCKFVGQRRFH